MNATVEKLVRIAFQDLREDPEVLEIREAVMRDCQERFEEMTGNGYTEDEAIAAIVESLQGMEEMMQSFQSTEKTEEKTPSRDEQIFQGKKICASLFSSDIHLLPSEDGYMHVHVQEEHRDDFQVEMDGDCLRIQEKEQSHAGREIRSMLSQMQSFSDLRRIVNQALQAVSSLGKQCITVRIPQDMETVEIRTMAGDLEVRQVDCRQMQVHTTSGDVRFTGKNRGTLLRLQTVSGDMDVRGLWQEASVSTVSGDCQMEGNMQKLNMTSVSGDLSIDWHSVEGRLLCKTTSGDIDIHTPASVNVVDMLFHTVSGDCTVHKHRQENAPCHIEARTVSGDLKID